MCPCYLGSGKLAARHLCVLTYFGYFDLKSLVKRESRPKMESIQQQMTVEIRFFYMVQPRPLLFIFHCKAFYNNDITNWAFNRNISASLTFRAYLSRREEILGRWHWCLLALQDGEVTILTQTSDDMKNVSCWRTKKIGY